MASYLTQGLYMNPLILLAGLVLTSAADAFYTLKAVKEGASEKNPILGKKPSSSPA